jgi:hypothetical protein
VNEEKNNENDKMRQQVGIAVMFDPRTFNEP